MDASREADRLSALPDDLLVDIVERLSDLRTTIRISTLSRRWARIPRLLPVLEIDVYDVMTRADSEFTTCSAEAAAAAHAATARWLLMDQPTGGGRKKLFLAFYLIDSFLQSLGHAVGDAVERGHTECLEFTIWTQVSAASASDLDLDLYGKKFMDACPVAFSWLTSLTLHNLCFGADDARRLLDAAIRLETLCLSHCASQTEVLEIDAPRSQLMVLELLSCYFEKVDLIRVPQLGQVNCDDWSGENNPPLRFGYVPRLHNVSLASSWQWQEPFALSECLSNTRNLSIVHLSFRGAKIWVKPEEPNQLFPVFSNLRDMYLYDISHESELDWTLYVLHAAPSLRNLYIKISRHICGRNNFEDETKMLWETPDFKHNNLSLLQIKGFAVEKKVMEYVRLVIQRAVNLKNIHLLEQDPCVACEDTCLRYPRLMRPPRFPVDERRKNMVRARLTDGVCSSAKISIG